MTKSGLSKDAAVTGRRSFVAVNSPNYKYVHRVLALKARFSVARASRRGDLGRSIAGKSGESPNPTFSEGGCTFVEAL